MNYALIFAGGVGNRMNSRAKPKQFLEIHGKPIIVHTIEHFQKSKLIDEICVVIVQEWIDYMKSLLEQYRLTKVKWLVPGGKSAIASQYNGLKAIESTDDNDIVLIHDGVRPIINEELIERCIDGVKTYGSAVTVAPAIETIIQVDADNMIHTTFPREACQLARAPQCFYLKDILFAHEQARSEGVHDFVDSTSMLLHYGKKIHTVTGPAENIKVTNPADFYICRALLDAKENSQIFGI